MTRLALFSGALRLSLLFFCSASVLAQTPDRAQIEKEIYSLRDQITAREKQFLAPSTEDQSTFAEFLHQPGTGLAQLLPREKYDGILAVRGGGAYYSFTRLIHEYGYGSNISLERDHFSTGFAGLDYGMIVALGSGPLDMVTLDHPAVQFLASYVPPSVEPEIRREQMRTGQGFKEGDFTYQSRVPATLNTTYVLRSVQYHGENGKGRDILIVFRTVRQDYDGSITLIWKMLKRFPAPQFERSGPAAATASP